MFKLVLIVIGLVLFTGIIVDVVDIIYEYKEKREKQYD